MNSLSDRSAYFPVVPEVSIHNMSQYQTSSSQENYLVVVYIQHQHSHNKSLKNLLEDTEPNTLIIIELTRSISGCKENKKQFQSTRFTVSSLTSLTNLTHSLMLKFDPVHIETKNIYTQSYAVTDNRGLTIPRYQRNNNWDENIILWPVWKKTLNWLSLTLQDESWCVKTRILWSRYWKLTTTKKQYGGPDSSHNTQPHSCPVCWCDGDGRGGPGEKDGASVYCARSWRRSGRGAFYHVPWCLCYIIVSSL